MTILHGHIENGQIVADEPIPNGSERQAVEIKILDAPAYPESSMEEIRQKIEEGRQDIEAGRTVSFDEAKSSLRTAEQLIDEIIAIVKKENPETDLFC